MADTLSKEKRSWNMSQVKNKDTSIEMKVRKYLFKQGFRYRKNDIRLPGKPDIVLPKYRVCIFVHGCFWHRHAGCKDTTTPKTRTQYWEAKFSRNVKNDMQHEIELRSKGWTVLTIWECEVNKQFEKHMQDLIAQIRAVS